MLSCLVGLQCIPLVVGQPRVFLVLTYLLVLIDQLTFVFCNWQPTLHPTTYRETSGCVDIGPDKDIVDT